jgi:hypothetical protein
MKGRRTRQRRTYIYTGVGIRTASEGIFYGSLQAVPEQTNLFSLSIDCAQDRTLSRR